MVQRILNLSWPSFKASLDQSYLAVFVFFIPRLMIRRYFLFLFKVICVRYIFCIQLSWRDRYFWFSVIWIIMDNSQTCIISLFLNCFSHVYYMIFLDIREVKNQLNSIFFLSEMPPLHISGKYLPLDRGWMLSNTCLVC